MANFIVVNNTTGLIASRVVIDVDPWPVPEGFSIFEETGDPMHIGGTYIDGVYTPPPPPPANIVR